MRFRRFDHIGIYDNDTYSTTWNISLALDKKVYRSPGLREHHVFYGLIITLICALLLFLIWYSPIAHIYPYLRAHFTPTAGAAVRTVEPVVDYEVTSGKNAGFKTYTYNLECEFEVNGTAYTAYIEGFRKSLEERDIKPGDGIVIHYDPNNPADNFYVHKYTSTGFPINLAAVITPFIILFMITAIRYMISGHFQTEKKYIYNYAKLEKPKPHNYDIDNMEDDY